MPTLTPEVSSPTPANSEATVVVGLTVDMELVVEIVPASVTAETTDVLVDVDELEEIDETEVVLEEEDDVLNELTEEDDVLNVVTDVGVEDDEVVVGDDVDVDVVRTVTTGVEMVATAALYSVTLTCWLLNSSMICPVTSCAVQPETCADMSSTAVGLVVSSLLTVTT